VSYFSIVPSRHRLSLILENQLNFLWVFLYCDFLTTVIYNARDSGGKIFDLKVITSYSRLEFSQVQLGVETNSLSVRSDSGRALPVVGAAALDFKFLEVNTSLCKPYCDLPIEILLYAIYSYHHVSQGVSPEHPSIFGIEWDHYKFTMECLFPFFKLDL
jgi:hypothetical protein